MHGLVNWAAAAEDDHFEQFDKLRDHFEEQFQSSFKMVPWSSSGAVVEHILSNY